MNRTRYSHTANNPLPVAKNHPTRTKEITTLAIFYQNVRGIKTKLHKWKTNMSLLDYDIIVATETFLDSSVENSEVVSTGWNVVRRDRNRPGGGVLVAAKPGVVPVRTYELDTADGEDLWVKFCIRGISVLICAVYIPPSASDSVYFDWFHKVESFVNDLKGNMFIIGDINLNSASKSVNSYFAYFLSFCSLTDQNNFFNVFGGKLDVVLSRDTDCAVQVQAAEAGGIVNVDSYHPPLDIEARLLKTWSEEKTCPSNLDSATDWNFSKADFVLLYEHLTKADWSCVTNATDVPSATGEFYSILYRIFDICLPKNGEQHLTENVILFGSPQILLEI